MNDFKFTLISSFIFIIIIGLGVLAFFALEPGDTNGSRQVISQLESDIEEKDEALQTALRRIAELESDNQPEEEQSNDTDNDTTPPPSSGEFDQLISDLENLVSRGVVLGPGNNGASVGTIQEFLNVYNDTSGGVDNDFGPTTRSRVEAFQEDAGISVDGGVGRGTLGAMIEWLENNS